jgi:diaminopropionate ammonia-lyase
MDDYFLNNASNLIPRNVTTQILESENPMEFHKSLPGYKPTPLHNLSGMARKFGLGAIYLKDESYRLGLNAFKGLGASFALSKVLNQQPKNIVFCTATDGNHGKAVAWSARLQNKKSVVFVPQNTSLERIQNIEKDGATVIDTGQNYDETCRIAKEEAAQNGWVLIQDTAWEGYEEIPAYIMAGYLTQFQEIEKQLDSLEKIDVIMLQAGVGSWAAAGIWYFVKNLKTKPKLVIVEPYESDGILASFKAGKRVSPNGNFKTIMAGLNCGIPSFSAWDIIKNGADASLRIKDDYAKIAMQELYTPTLNDPQIVAGESGVGGLAGLLYLMSNPNAQNLRNHLQISSNTNVLCISTEGATDKKMHEKIINQANIKKIALKFTSN